MLGENLESTLGSVRVLDRSSFCVSDIRGDVSGRREEGLFFKDTRHLSRLVLLVDGERPALLSSEAADGRAGFFMAAPAGGKPNGLSVMRRRRLDDGLEEEVLLTNHGPEAAEAVVEVEIDADFADLFEVRGHRAFRPGEALRRVEEDGATMLFAYRRGPFRRATRARFASNAGGLEMEPGHAAVALRLEAGGSARLSVSVSLEEDEGPVRKPTAAPETPQSPVLSTDGGLLGGAWERSLLDLKALEFRLGPGEERLYAAGLPWYMALFGRDSLITCLQTVFIAPEVAETTLRALAARQADGFDDFRDAEPGKILHELRSGELAFFGDIPHSPYYGTVDATPLFLVLLHELWRWTADGALARELEASARRALAWMDGHADTDGDGYADYATRSPRGITNQGWKDSGNSVLFRDGTMARGPVAFCEVQGYLYDARLRAAELAEKVWDDPDLAEAQRREAAALKARFDRDFWMEDRGFYALARDGDGRQVDAITSNPGHLLWSGIVPEEKAALLAGRLVGDGLFSGWGVRTMAEGEGGYNPIEYHNGTVWPHDCSLISYGLHRYGFREEANRITAGLLAAAPHFGYRLPEVFAGYARSDTGFPVVYPATCSPQAWAAGSVPLLVRGMLGLEPDPETRRLTTAPALPDGVGALHLEGVPAFGCRHEVGA